jgi:hypothetical protein
MNKKSAIVLALGLITFVTIPAFAQTTTTAPTTTTTNPPVTSTTTPIEQPILQVGATGDALLRGTIASISTGVITVTSWGGTWTVNVAPGTQALPGGDITQFKVGDFLGVHGAVSQTANLTINATLIRDWTYHQIVSQEEHQNVSAAHQAMQSAPQNYVGIASNLNGTSFTLTINGTANTVNVATGAEIVNRKYLTIPLTSISSGDTVRVWGVNTDGTIAAQIVRDVSIPATSTPQ